MTRTTTARRWTLCVSATLALLAGTSALGQSADPISSDPPSTDAAFPAGLRSYTIKIDSATLNGRALLAQGKGPHPTILLLHGMPGNELNMDVAQAARRAGWNVFTFHYRGSWGSGGEYSFNNVLADTAAALTHIRGLAADANWRVDSKRVVLVGHSVGGFAALTVGAADPEVRSIASISGFDAGRNGNAIAGDQARKERFIGLLKNMNGLRVSDPEALVAQWVSAAPEWQFEKLPPRLGKKNVLLVAASKDTSNPPATHHAPLAAALKAGLGATFTEVWLDTDHSYSDRRIALTRAVLVWLEGQR
jgi:uncharacterized protein